MRGVAACVLAACFEQARMPCEVLWEDTVGSHHSRRRMILEAPVKLAAQPVDLGRMAFQLAHPSMLRRLTFSVQEHEDADVRKEFGFTDVAGYGTVRDNPFIADDPQAIYFSGLEAGDPNRWTPANVIQEIKKQLTERGISLLRA